MTVSGTSKKRQAATVGLVSGGHFFSHFHGLVLPPLFPLLVDALEVTYLELGVLVAVMAAGSAVAQFPAGVFVDRFGAFWVLIAGLALRSAAVVLMGFATSYWQLWGLALVAGIGNSVFHPADYSILSSMIPAQRLGRAFSVHTFAGHMGWAAAPVFMGLCAMGLGWRGALFAAGGAGIVMCGLLLTQRRLFLPVALLRDQEIDRAGWSQDRRRLSEILTLPLMAVSLVFLLDAMAMTGFQTFLVPASVSAHQNAVSFASLLLTVFFTGSAMGVLGGGVVADRTSGHATSAAASLVVTAGFITLLPLVTAPAILLLVVALAGLCHGMLPPFRDLIVRSFCSAASTGRVFAVVSIGFDIGTAVAPVLFGLTYDKFGANGLFWTSAACLLGAGASVGAIVLPKTRPSLDAVH